jgi:hypothetical protein
VIFSDKISLHPPTHSHCDTQTHTKMAKSPRERIAIKLIKHRKTSNRRVSIAYRRNNNSSRRIIWYTTSHRFNANVPHNNAMSNIYAFVCHHVLEWMPFGLFHRWCVIRAHVRALTSYLLRLPSLPFRHMRLCHGMINNLRIVDVCFLLILAGWEEKYLCVCDACVTCVGARSEVTWGRN